MNLAFSAINGTADTEPANNAGEVFALLLHAVASVRLARGRMLSNFLITAEQC